MRRLHLLLLAVSAAVVLAACGAGAGGEASPTGPPGSPAVVGEAAAPALTLTTFAGGERPLGEFHAERPLVVNFWASWCGPCVAEMPDFEAVHRRLEGRVGFLGINTQDRREAAEELADRTGVTYPLARDPSGSVARDFGVLGMPSTFFISADGRIVDRHTGPLTEADLLAAIETSLLNGSRP